MQYHIAKSFVVQHHFENMKLEIMFQAFEKN